MSDDVYMDFIGYSLGDKVESIEEANQRELLISNPEILRETGFDSHHFCSDGMTSYDLANLAVKNTFSKIESDGVDIDKSDIDAILYATCITENGNLGSRKKFEETKDVKPLMDYPVSHLQADLGMDNAFLMGLNQTACTSLLGTLRFGSALLKAEPDLNYAICVTADRFPKGAIYEQVFNLISDGSASCLLRRDTGKFKILACHHISNGAMAQANDDETAGFYFNYTVRSISETLSKIDFSFGDIDWVVPQNTFDRAWEVMASFLSISMDRVLMPSRSTVAHCISGDNAINLSMSDDAGVFSPGDIIVMPMAGFGLNWSCVVLEKI